MLPVSSSASIRCQVEPHSASPSRSAHASGIGPRCRGSSAGCMLIEPRRGTSSAACGIFHGKPQHVSRSGSYARTSRSIACLSRAKSRSTPAGALAGLRRRNSGGSSPSSRRAERSATGSWPSSRSVPASTSAIGLIVQTMTTRQDSAMRRAYAERITLPGDGAYAVLVDDQCGGVASLRQPPTLKETPCTRTFAEPPVSPATVGGD